MKTFIKKYLSLLLKIFISLILLFLLFQKIDVFSVLQELKSITIVQFLIMLGICLIWLLIRIVKWQLLLPDISFFLLTKASFYSRFYSLVLPGQIFGEVAKAAIISKDTNNIDKGTTSVVIDKITGLIGVFLVGIIGFAFTETKVPIIIFFMMILLMICVLAMLFMIKIPIFYRFILLVFNKLAVKFKRLSSFFSKIISMLDTWKNYSSNTKLIAKSIFYSILCEFFTAFFYMVICYFLNINISLFDLCWINAAVGVILLIPITFGGIGLREGTLVGLFYYIGIAAESALSLSFIQFFLSFILAIIGAFFVMKDTFYTKPSQ